MRYLNEGHLCDCFERMHKTSDVLQNGIAEHSPRRARGPQVEAKGRAGERGGRWAGGPDGGAAAAAAGGGGRTGRRLGESLSKSAARTG